MSGKRETEEIRTALSTPPHYLLRVTPRNDGGDSDKARIYIDPSTDREYPSVTSITGKDVSRNISRAVRGIHKRFLEDNDGRPVDQEFITEILNAPNKEFERSRIIGSEVHDIFDGILSGHEDISISNQYYRAIEAFNKWRSSIDAVYLESEVAVFYDDGNIAYAGTIDALYQKPDGSLLVVDWKTGGNGKGGIYPEYMIQLSAYCRALTYMTGHETSGMVVRMVMEYPQVQGFTPTGRPRKNRAGELVLEDDRRQAKYFTGECEMALVNPDDYLPAFDSTIITNRIKEETVETVIIGGCGL